MWRMGMFSIALHTKKKGPKRFEYAEYDEWLVHVHKLNDLNLFISSSTWCRQRPLTSCQILALWRYTNIFISHNMQPAEL